MVQRNTQTLRKFEDAANGGDARTAIALADFRKLYDIERSCKDHGV